MSCPLEQQLMHILNVHAMSLNYYECRFILHHMGL